MATIPGALPEEYSRELMHLQSNAPPMGSLFVKRRMSQELGNHWPSKFTSFTLEAAAAASLGQVHKAIHLNGTDLACKLQYPDMESTVQDDLSQLKLLLGIYQKTSNALNTQDIYRELKERLLEELDYTQEARHVVYYQKALETMEGVAVPKIFPNLSTKKILTMSWLEGESILSMKPLSLDIRNEIAARLFRVWYTPFYTYGMIHGDPHLGNYTVGKDYNINLMDFGCIRLFKGTFIQGVIDLYHSLLNQDQDLAIQAYETWGFTNLNKDLIQVLNMWAHFLFDPLLEDRVRTIHSHHETSYGQEMASKVHKALHKAGGVKPPREFLMMDRAAVGMGGVFMHLEARLNWHQEYQNLIEGFNAQALEAKQKHLISSLE